VALRAPLPNEQESVGALIQRVGTDVSRIVRAEIRLMQLRATEAGRVVKEAGTGLGAAVLLGLAGFGALTAGIVLLVGALMPVWLAAFAVGGGFILIAAVILLIEVKSVTRGVAEVLTPVETLAPREEGPYGR
jgi:Putative Actinobacterial Holin-X, holin superfamily III